MAWRQLKEMKDWMGEKKKAMRGSRPLCLRVAQTVTIILDKSTLPLMHTKLLPYKYYSPPLTVFRHDPHKYWIIRQTRSKDRIGTNVVTETTVSVPPQDMRKRGLGTPNRRGSGETWYATVI